MATDNKSPSYLREREEVRRWLTTTPDGRETAELLRKHAPGGDAAAILDNDIFTDWAEIVREYKGAVVLSANCREARNAFELARQSKNTMGPPGLSKNNWVRFFSAPIGYVLRRQIEVCDPEYWNDPKNVYREALEHPQWCCVPPDVIRGELEKMLPRDKSSKVVKSGAPDAA